MRSARTSCTVGSKLKETRTPVSLAPDQSQGAGFLDDLGEIFGLLVAFRRGPRNRAGGE